MYLKHEPHHVLDQARRVGPEQQNHQKPERSVYQLVLCFVPQQENQPSGGNPPVLEDHNDQLTLRMRAQEHREALMSLSPHPKDRKEYETAPEVVYPSYPRDAAFMKVEIANRTHHFQNGSAVKNLITTAKH
ncbi:hypothetical protein D3C87_1466100 [compost metagenome]